jgi:hypothetical protein
MANADQVTESSSGATDRLCQQVTTDGRKCQARRISGSRHCFFHAPERRTERAAARRAGGLKKRMATLPEVTPDAPLANAHDVSELLAQTINQVRRGELDPKVGNAVGYLAGIFLKTIQQTEIENRIAALEAGIKRQPDAAAFSFDEN